MFLEMQKQMEIAGSEVWAVGNGLKIFTEVVSLPHPPVLYL
jgi:hypothetical protein